MDFFNIFTSQYATVDIPGFKEVGVGGRILHQSADGRHLTIVTQYPNGIRGKFADVDYCEVFYVVRGEGTRNFPDGRSEPMTAGDLIYVPPGVDMECVYSPDFMDVAFFWSEHKPLPDYLTGGLTPLIRE